MSSDSSESLDSSFANGLTKLSFRNYPRHLAEKVLRIPNLELFIHRQEIRPENLIELIQPPTVLLDAVFERLADTLSISPFPRSIETIAGDSAFVDAILLPVISQVKSDLKLGKCLWIDSRSVQGIQEDNDEQTLVHQVVYVVQYWSKRTNLVILVLKYGCIDDGYALCMLYMLRAYELNNDRLKVYGFCSDTVDWNLISFDGDAFKMLFRRRSMFPGLDKSVEQEEINEKGDKVITMFYPNKELWKREYSEIVAIIYSCLISLAAEVKKRKEENEEREKMDEGGEAEKPQNGEI